MDLKSMKKLLAVAVTAAGCAMAAPTQADPLAFLPQNTSIQFKYDNFENPIVTAANQTLSGIFLVSSILDNNTLGTYWADRISDGTSLVGFFDGLVSQTPTASGTGGFDINFTGGTLTIYNVPAGTVANPTFNPTSPGDSFANQLCGGACPTPFLTMDFVGGVFPSDPTVTLRSHVDTLSAPLTGSGFGRLEVTGGTAAGAFGSEFSLNSNFQSCPATGPNASLCNNAGAWPIASFDPVTGRTIPEPGSLALLAAGFLAAAGLRKRFPRR